MPPPRIVLDTNVLVAALRSSLGASHLLLQLVGTDRFDLILTVSGTDVEVVLSYIANVGVPQSVFYLWRPSARDPDDDLVIEAAVAGQCEYLVTFNLRHLAPAAAFGCEVLTPREFLRKIGVKP